MIQFRQKQFSEYDAMKSLYEQILRRTGGDRNRKFKIINQSALIPILKGNNVVIEKFTISTSMFDREKYRMYIKIGAKAKLPDEVRLPRTKEYDDKLGKVSLRLNGGIFRKSFSNIEGTLFQKEFKGGGGGGEKPVISAEGSNDIYLNVKRREVLGETFSYSKAQRSLVLEFKTINDAIDALNILPFGLNYQIYLLDA